MNLTVIPLGSYQANCYMLENPTEVILIDPGAMEPSLEKALQGKNLRHILITHGHLDHVGGVQALSQQFPQAKIWIHPGDCASENSQIFPIANRHQEDFLEEGGKIPTEEGDILVHHTPGHSKGSVCFQYQDMLFTGDTLFRGSMGRTDFAGGNYQEIMASLKKLAQLEGDFKVFPGHEASSTLDSERKNNPYILEALRT